MPITFAQLATRSLPLSLSITGETEPLNLELNASALTPAFEQELGGAHMSGEMLARMLSRLVVKWDLQGENGKPYPLAEEDLARLPCWFLMDITAEIVGAVVPKPTTPSE